MKKDRIPKELECFFTIRIQTSWLDKSLAVDTADNMMDFSKNEDNEDYAYYADFEKTIKRKLCIETFNILK